MSFQSAGTFTFEVRQLTEMALEIEPNATWTYEAMSGRLDREITGNDPALQEVLKRLARDHGREFKNVRKVGYLRLDDVGIVEHGPNDRKAIGRRVKRAARRTGNIKEWEVLADRYKRDADAHRSILGLLRHVLKPSSVKKIRDEVDRAHNEIAVEDTLALFKRKRNGGE